MESIATWLAPIATTLAALMTASNLGTRITGWGFIVFTIGSLAWLTLSIATGQSNLLWQNIILTALNLFGIWRWLGRQAKLEEGGKKAAQASEKNPSEAMFPVSLLTKAKLTGSDGIDLGVSVDAMANAKQGEIAYVVVSSGGVGGIGETVRRVDWRDLNVDEDRLTTHLDQPGFNRLEQVAKDDWR